MTVWTHFYVVNNYCTCPSFQRIVKKYANTVSVCVVHDYFVVWYNDVKLFLNKKLCCSFFSSFSCGLDKVKFFKLRRYCLNVSDQQPGKYCGLLTLLSIYGFQFKSWSLSEITETESFFFSSRVSYELLSSALIIAIKKKYTLTTQFRKLFQLHTV